MQRILAPWHVCTNSGPLSISQTYWYTHSIERTCRLTSHSFSSSLRKHIALWELFSVTHPSGWPCGNYCSHQPVWMALWQLFAVINQSEWHCGNCSLLQLLTVVNPPEWVCDNWLGYASMIIFHQMIQPPHSNSSSTKLFSLTMYTLLFTCAHEWDLGLCWCYVIHALKKVKVNTAVIKDH